MDDTDDTVRYGNPLGPDAEAPPAEPPKLVPRKRRPAGENAHQDATLSAADGEESDARRGGCCSGLSLGEKVGAAVLITPTLLNWLVLAVEASWLGGTVELADGDGVSHTVLRIHTRNFEYIFLNASVTCIATVFAHVWLTMGAIARRHTLGNADETFAGEGGLSARMRGKLKDMEEKELMQAAKTAGVTQGQLDAKTEGHEKFGDYRTELIVLVKETSSSGSYAVRLQRAEVEAGKLSGAERAHLALVGFDFFFAAFVVFRAAFDHDRMFQVVLGILPGAVTALLVRYVLAPARAAVLRTQRMDSVVFAGDALRGSMAVLMVQVLVLARCVRSLLRFSILYACQCILIGMLLPRFAAFAVDCHVDLLIGDCDESNNTTCCRGAESGCKDIPAGDGDCDIDSDCAGSLVCGESSCEQTSGMYDSFDDCCVEGTEGRLSEYQLPGQSLRNSTVTVYEGHAPLLYQSNGSLAVIYYLLVACVLFFAARGQGLLHDKLFTELDMTWTHVVALLFWFLATFGAVLSLAVMWAEWGDVAAIQPFEIAAHVCTGVGLIGMVGVLWKDTIQGVLGLGHDDTKRATRLHTAVKDGNAEALQHHLQAHGDDAGLQLVGDGLSSATPLQRAACLGRAEIVNILLPKGNKFVKKEVVDAKAPCGFTALHFCCLFGRAKIAQALIKAGANTELTNDRGQTAWDVALAQPPQSEGRDAVAQVLRRDVDLANRPEVEKTFRDDLELDFARLIFASVILFENWEFLAEGAFGKVYLICNVFPPVCIGARQFSKFVVKVAKTGAKGASDDLKQEVQSLAKLTHVNIVSILGFVHGPAPGESGATWMMCLEYCESDLNKMLHGKEKKLHVDHTAEDKAKITSSNKELTELQADYTPELRTDLICDIIRGVAYLHSQGKVHCDLKPENILLARTSVLPAKDASKAARWTAKVADFGAQVGGAEPSSVSAKMGATGGSVKVDKWLGTYLWMAPEATGLNAEKGFEHGHISQEPAEPTFGATDVFSLSLMVWEMVTRELPHEGLSLGDFSEVWVSNSGKEDRRVTKGNEPAGGTWTKDFRHVAKSYYNGNRPTVPGDCPTLLAKLMVAGWAAKQGDRPSSAYLQRLVDEIDPERWWLKPPDAPAGDGQPASYTVFLTKLGLQDKVKALADCGLDEGLELKQLTEHDDQELDDDILNDEDLDLDDETKESFRAAVAELKGQAAAAAQSQAAESDADSDAYAALEQEAGIPPARTNEELASELAETKAMLRGLETRLAALEKKEKKE